MVTDQVVDSPYNYFQMKEMKIIFNLNLHDGKGNINTCKHELICLNKLFP